MRLLLAVGLGGFLGAIARHLLGGWIQDLAGGKFPWGVLAANVLGCLAIGYLTGVAARSAGMPEHWRLFLVTGVLGALTTFSTFGLDTVQLAKGDLPMLALANVAANLILSLGAVTAGLALAR